MTRIFTFFLLVANTLFFYSQSTGITYQALIINPQGENVPGVNNTSAPLANKDICMRFSIYDNNNQAEYVETIKTTTDKSGIVNLIIGSGSKVGGYASSFSAIVWDKNLKRLKVEFDVTANCSSYLEISNQTFSYVPFTYYSSSTKEATSTTTGSVKLAGDLAGTGSTAQSPKITDGAITSNKIANGAIVNSKIGELISVTNGGTGNSNIVGYVVGNGINPMTGVTSIPVSDINGAQTIANLEANITSSTDPQNKYPSVKAVKDYISGSLAIASIPDADATTKGKIQLAGDLAGTAATPTIASGAVNTAKLADGSVTSAKISDGTIANVDVSATAAIAYSKLNLNNSVVTADITNNAVTTPKINDAAVTTSKLADNSVSTAKIADANITYTKIQNVSATDKVLGRVSTGAGTIEEISTTGSGNVVRANSPTLVTPNLGTPSAIDLSNATNLPINTAVTGVLPIANGGTGSATQNFVDLTTNQTIAGNKEFSSDIKVNGITVGRGQGNDEMNTAIGGGALGSGTGTRNTAIGAAAMANYSGTSFDNNTAVGYFNSVRLTSGQQNTSIGAESLMEVTTGFGNTAIGAQNLLNTTGSGNTGLGYSAGNGVTNGNNNTFLGIGANTSSSSVNNSTAVGHDAVVSGDNTIQLGNNDITSVKTAGKLTTGDITYPNNVGNAGQVLKTDGSGNASWSDPAINTNDIVDGAVTDAKLADNAVVTSKINDGAVTNGKLADNAVNTSKIDDDAITTAKLKDGEVTDAKLASGISASKVGLGNVDNTSDADKPVSTAQQTALNLKENLSNKSTDVATDAASDTKYPSVKAIKNYVDTSIASATIADADATTKGKLQLAGDLTGTAASPAIAASAITTAKIADDGVTSAKIKDGEIVNADVSSTAAIAYSKLSLSNSITTSDIADGAITTDKIASSAVTTGKLADNAVNAYKIDDDAVVTSKIKDAAVTTSKLADNAVNAYKIDDDAVVTSKIKDAAVTTSKLADNAVNAYKIDDDAVVTSKIKDGAVTDAKLASGISASKVGLGNVDNTSDANKPVSTAQQTALDLKENLSNKSTDIATDAASNTKYPSVKAIKNYVDSSISSATIADADATTKGKLQLAGDLTGTAASPAIASSAVTSAKILDGTIAVADIADDAIETAKIKNANVTTAKLADASVTNAKLAEAISVANGGTGLTTLSAGKIPFGNGTSAFGSSSNLFWDNTNSRLGINTSTPSATFQIGTDCSSCADNLKYFVNNSYNTLKLGFRSSGWHMRTSNNSGVATDLLFSYQDGNNAISDIMTISTLGTVNIPGTLEVTGTSKADTGTFSNLNIGTNNDINYSSTTGKFGIFGTPSAPFQIYGDGGFEYPLKYTSDGQSGGTLGFGFRNKQFKINTTSDSGVLNNMIYSYDDGNSNNTEIMRLTYDGKLSITGGLHINSNSGLGKVLTSDANGNASWENVSATNLASSVTGTLPLANGGTGATTASAAKTNLALENVDNTSDADKPVSTAQQTALNLKENLSNKSTDVATDAASNTKYPSVKAIKNYVDTQVAGATIADADATTKGKLQLAGDLTGTAASPTIAASAVTTSKVAASAISTAKIADDAVTSAKILDGTIANADISSTAAIAYSKLNLTGSIATADLADSAVTTAKINDGAITSAKLSDGSIATGDLADGAVTTSKITDANITYAKIQNVSATDKVLGRVSTGAGTIEEISTTGSGSVVRATSPTLVTPVIGAATGTSLSVSGQLTSTVATGTAPLVVTSTTPVANLSIGGNAATATSASTATNIAGGAAGSLPYQTAAGTTSLLAKGTDGQILTLASGVPSWAAAPTSGVTTMAAIGSTPNANGASISSSTLTLQPANATNGGVVTTAAQTFAGAKTFSSDLTVNGMTVGLGGGSAGSASDTSGASTNVAIGVNTLRLNAGTFQTAIGSDALKSSGSYGLGTVAVGSGAFRSLNNASGSQDRNTAVGTGAYYQLATGQYNVGLGEAVLFSATSGSDNVALGRHAGFGSSTGAAVTSANQSVLIGSDASPFATTTTNEIAIGYAAKGAGDNTTTIGNSSTTKSIIFGSTSLSNLPTTAASGAAGGNFTLTAQNANGTNTKGGDIILTPGTATGTGTAGIVQVNGQVKITGGTPGAGKVLTSDANGVATWSNNTGGGVLSKSASYTILTTDSANYVVFSGATASQTITLPSAVTVGAGREITIKNVASVSLTINASAGYLISDSTTTTATSLAVGIEPSNNWIKAISDGTNWIILRALF